MAKITKLPDGTHFECAEGDTILRAALRSGLGMPYSCNVGSCGNCRFELIEGEVVHQRTDAPAWSDRDLQRNRWLGCQAEPKGDCTIKFREDPNAVSQDRPAVRNAELLSVTPLTRDISEFRFKIGADDGFRPGQYALLKPPGIQGGRAYSMSNLPNDGTWQFMIKLVPDGAATGHLFNQAQPGDKVYIDGPYGTAWLREDIPRDILLVAGGSGLSPMVSIAKGAFAAKLLDDRKLRFFYGARSQADLFEPLSVFGADLAARIEYTAALSEPAPGWSGPTGLLPDIIYDRMGSSVADHELYFAGPPAMSTAMQKMAHSAGLPMDRAHFDDFY